MLTWKKTSACLKNEPDFILQSSPFCGATEWVGRMGKVKTNAVCSSVRQWWPWPRRQRGLAGNHGSPLSPAEWASLGEAVIQTQEHWPWSQSTWVQIPGPHLGDEAYKCCLVRNKCWPWCPPLGSKLHEGRDFSVLFTIKPQQITANTRLTTCSMNEYWKTYITSPKPWLLHLQNGLVTSSPHSYSEAELKQ